MRLGQRSAAAGVVLRDRPAGGILLVSTAQGTVGRDARELVWELGRERLSEDDVVCQPVDHRYVRATSRPRRRSRRRMSSASVA